jgi:hypothetical protein
MRSSSMPDRGSPVAATNISANDGIAPRDIDPRISGLTGTSRQPRTVRPSSVAMASIDVRAEAACSGSIGRNAMPQA